MIQENDPPVKTSPPPTSWHKYTRPVSVKKRSAMSDGAKEQLNKYIDRIVSWYVIPSEAYGDALLAEIVHAAATAIHKYRREEGR